MLQRLARTSLGLTDRARDCNCVIGAIVDLLFPAQCANCGRIGSGLCDHCAPGGAPPKYSRTASLYVSALGTYDGALRRAVLALKDGRRDVAQALGERLAALVPANATIVSVPTTRARRRARGFDGCRELALVASKQCDAVSMNVLRQVAGDAQRGRGRTDRLLARGRFVCAPLHGENVVLLDDVMSTGATLEDCAATIRRSGGIVNQAVVVAINDRPHIHEGIT